ncbi:MAG: hypothetical protein CVT90_02985 [Candidatus Altiarchaeales archaeon HGW-Altiarchaeales-3]|nr:MAG: hypothetical protein CVT90_02985 [Candidatus Altiarchaeales archaeon HGW-Altiarchaeales-3]
MNYTIKQHKKNIKKDDYSFFVLGGDIGGNNTTLGVAGIRKNSNKPTQLFSFHFKSRELDSLIPALKLVCNYSRDNYGIELKNACFGAAGAVLEEQDFAELTNLDWAIDAKEILKKTPLESVVIINDFQAIGYGINCLDFCSCDDIIKLKPGISDKSGQTKAIIGAGTGLGKSILFYDRQNELYIPMPSEGGHGDFPVYDEFELNLLNFIKKSGGSKKPVSYEEVLSGRGIAAIYMFLRSTGKFKTTEYTCEIESGEDKAPIISKYRSVDETCAETFKIYTKFYGRCAKNFVLDTLATGGLYIAGGIASKNREIFKTGEFINEFENAKNQVEILRKIQGYVIVNYDVGLYGAQVYAVQRIKENIR